ncbi:MAG TPA: arylsulfotransferase family protein [Myxococcota bacterium]|nr:arylsulfotransferase family protein [Myxococcota bacterium]
MRSTGGRAFWSFAGLALVASLSLGAAADAPKPPRAASPEELEQLRALGYVDFSAEAPPAAKSGVVARDPARSAPGYSLYASRPLRRAELLDPDGRAVRVWEAPGPGHWSHVRLLPGGDLLVVGSASEKPEGGRLADQARYLERRSFDGAVRWRLPIPVHHDVNVAPDGRLLALVSEDRVVPAVATDAEVRDEGVAIVTPEGVVQERKLLVPMLLARPDVFRVLQVKKRPLGERRLMDLLHANSVEWMARPELASRHPLYALGNVLVSMRNQDAIAVFDWAKEEVVWTWGQGEIRGPHCASLLEGGNVLLFDNRLGEGWSRVVELDPVARRVVWEWRAPTPTDFYTASRGSAQRLPNGNTLVAESDRGHAFEVTPDGAVVWDWWNPHRDAAGRPATIIRMHRHPPSEIDPLLRR